MKVFQDYKATLRAAAISWGASVVLVGARIMEWLPLQYTGLSLLTVGVGIATSVSLSRFRLTEAITTVFQVGLTSAITMSANVFTDTAIMQLSSDGCIEDVDHADAIGWHADDLIGRRLCDLLAPRSHDGCVREIEPGVTISSPMLNGVGGKFDARITVTSLASRDPQIEDRRMIATVAPVVQSLNN